MMRPLWAQENAIPARVFSSTVLIENNNMSLRTNETKYVQINNLGTLFHPTPPPVV